MAATKWNQVFNAKLKEFLHDMIQAYPQDKDFRFFKTSLDMVCTLSPKIPQQLFHAHTAAFYPKIDARDQDFFVEDDEFHATLQSQDITGELIDKLRGYWKDMGEENKESIWKYLELLVALDRKIASQ